MKKPQWVIDKERAKRAEGQETVWLFGLHAVRDALDNPARDRRRLIVTRNAADRLAEAIGRAGIDPELADARAFPAPLDRDSVHQGAALEVAPLDWGPPEAVCRAVPGARLVLLDRVSDPHNAGAILRTAEVLGAQAVIGVRRHAAPETGALAKAASGALERQPYIRVRNLATTMEALSADGFTLVGLDAEGTTTVGDLARSLGPTPVALVMGAEGPGLRDRTKALCDHLVRIEPKGAFGSLNVSNAAAISLYAFTDAAEDR